LLEGAMSILLDAIVSIAAALAVLVAAHFMIWTASLAPIAEADIGACLQCACSGSEHQVPTD
jgi:hypothetical protein